MHKIYTFKYFAIWSKYTHVNKRMFTLRSHNYSKRYTHLMYSRHVNAVDISCRIICALGLHMGCLMENYKDERIISSVVD